ncbi:hypothetical protein Ddye_024686 [Dipteronia dyeriana]|uniref:Uncharacterized protein n=1 Tax=Dipteronia dyeriana TaxID=168575 RepID=A0AAD9TWC2_9ROSI|nr:hypothetical protein Ddye_024686 [Dipteronia dyeriana]
MISKVRPDQSLQTHTMKWVEGETRPTHYSGSKIYRFTDLLVSVDGGYEIFGETRRVLAVCLRLEVVAAVLVADSNTTINPSSLTNLDFESICADVVDLGAMGVVMVEDVMIFTKHWPVLKAFGDICVGVTVYAFEGR